MSIAVVKAILDNHFRRPLVGPNFAIFGRKQGLNVNYLLQMGYVMLGVCMSV